MKTRHILSGILMLLGLGTVLSSCEEEPIFETTGSVVVFSANTGYDNGIGTRTSYSGSDFTGGAATYERIDWVENDRIRIQSPQARTAAGAEYADYKVVGSTANGKYSNAELAQLTETSNGLEWASGLNYFYALYPAPSTDGLENPITFSGRDFVCSIPAVQTLTQNAVTGIWEPNMNDAYMWAAAKARQSDGEVQLDFQPAVTALQFTVGCAESAAMTLYSFELSSTSKALTGRLTAQINEDLTSCTYNCPERTADNSKITVNFNGTQGIVIPAGESLSFTVFAMPQDLTNLTAKFTTNNGTRSLKLNENNVPVTFDACKKYRILQLGIPGARVYYIDPIANQSRNYNGGNRNISVKSYSVMNGQKRGENWYLEYSINGGSTWTKMTASQHPAWLTANNYGGTGSPDGVTVQLNIVPGTKSKIDKDQSNNFSRTSFVSRDKNHPYDLSTHDIFGNVWSDGHIETANSYVVKKPGWYMFPLVYGNAINTKRVNNTTTGNKNAYAPSSASASNTYLTPFKKHDNQGITSPYIAVGSNPKAKVAWQDSYSEIIQEVNRTTGAVYLDIVDGSAVGGSLNCKYIRFYIDPVKEGEDQDIDHMQRANAVIKVLNGNTTLWSWHIWMIDQSLSDVQVKYFKQTGGTAQLYFLNMNLGWVNSTKLVTDYYQPEKCMVRAVNAASTDVVAEFQVSRTENVGTTWTPENVKIGPLWQWGRKDPMLPIFSSDGSDVGYDKAYKPGTDSWDTTHSRSATTTIGWSIQHPFAFVRGAGTAGETGTSFDWMYDRSGNAHYYNLWDATQTVHSGNSLPNGNSGYELDGNNYTDRKLPTAIHANAGADKAVVKTVYDPCPPGYCVPRRNAFTGFLRTNHVTTGVPGTTGTYGTWTTGSWNRGWNFRTQQTNNTPNIFFPADGARDWESGGLMYNSSFHWTAAALDAYHVAYMNINSGFIGPLFGVYNLAYRSRGHSVRPQKEEY